MCRVLNAPLCSNDRSHMIRNRLAVSPAGGGSPFSAARVLIDIIRLAMIFRQAVDTRSALLLFAHCRPQLLDWLWSLIELSRSLRSAAGESCEVAWLPLTVEPLCDHLGRYGDRRGPCPLTGGTRKTFAHTEFFSVCRVARRTFTSGLSQNRT